MGAWRWSGDGALLRAFEGDLGEANARALALWRALAWRALPEVADLVPGARTLLVVLRPGAEPGPELLDALADPPPPARAAEGRHHRVVVRYDGPDLDAVARTHGLSRAEVVRLHAEPTYTVAFIGFSPGFPYLLGLHRVLETPRLATPRTSVPAGSVGIGGPYTGIYPRATPGGWNLIGTTDRVLFDAAADPPALLSPGDTVRFVPS